MKKIALILVFALLVMTFAACGNAKPTDDDSDINPEELLGNKDENPGEEKEDEKIKYDCVYEKYTYNLYVEENYIEITAYDFSEKTVDEVPAIDDAEAEETIVTIDIKIPAKIDGVPVKKIATGAFAKNEVVASVEIPEGVTEIADEAFWFSKSLESVKLPSTLTKLGKRVFAYCPALTALAIPASITEIPAGLCTECTALVDLTFGNKVTSIGDAAFAYCVSLETVNFGTALTTVGAGAFKWCTSLTKATLPATAKDVAEDAFANCTALGK